MVSRSDKGWAGNQVDRRTDGKVDMWSDGKADRRTGGRWTDGHVDLWTCEQVNRHTGRPVDGWTEIDVDHWIAEGEAKGASAILLLWKRRVGWTVLAGVLLLQVCIASR